MDTRRGNLRVRMVVVGACIWAHRQFLALGDSSLELCGQRAVLCAAVKVDFFLGEQSKAQESVGSLPGPPTRYPQHRAAPAACSAGSTQSRT